MINRQEIMEFAREFGLAPNVVEKDYVLGWMLAGIAADRDIGSNWVFKGGTCLKKCYFETYRFSEDLDFTLIDPAHLNEDFLVTTFTRIAGWIYDQSGIEMPQDTIRFERYNNPRGNLSAQGRIAYRGPMGRGGDAPRIRLDLTDDEILVMEPTIRDVHHPYSDGPDEGIHVRCYSFEEVFAEKLRALAERGRPRDLYDVVHLYRHDELRPERVVIFDTLGRKCEFKGIPVPTPDVDDTWRPPAMAQAWYTSTPLEIVRFAAANRLCVDLAYQGSRRLIEPYSLRQTRDGNLLLYAVKHETGEERSYRVDRIEGAQATQTPFVARYLVELTPVGAISAPPTARRTTASSPAHPRTTRRTTARSVGPKYVFECTYCGKRFTRTSYNAVMNPHKDKRGYPCPGRVGIYVDTKY